MILVKLLALIFFTFNISQVEAKHFAITSFERGGGMPTAVLPPDQDAQAGAVVEISGRESTDPEEDDLMYRWSIDVAPLGSNSKINDPSAEEITLTPDMKGLYIIKLVVSDDMSNSYPAYTAVRVLSVNQLPVIPNYHFHGHPDEQVPVEVQFIIEGGAHDPDGKIVLFEYDFGNGKTTELSGEVYEANNRTVLAHAYETTGNYTATITAVDDRGGRTPITFNVNINANKHPLPKFAVNVVPNTQDPTSYDIRMDGTIASDPDGTIVHYEWNVFDPNGTNTQYYGASMSQATHTVTADKLGEYRIVFQVIDNNDANPHVGANFYVGADNPNFNAAPTPIYRVSPRIGTAPHTVNFDASSSFDIDGDDFSVSWYFDSDDTNLYPILRGATASHTFTRPGVYVGQVVITDTHGNRSMNYFPFYIKSPEDINLETGVFPMNTGDPLEFEFYHGKSHGMINTVPDTNYFWDFGDGGKGTDRVVNYRYQREGTYLVRLTTVDFFGKRKTFTKPLTVRSDGGIPRAGFDIEGGGIHNVNTPVVFNHAGHSESATGAPLIFSYHFREKDPLVYDVLGGTALNTFEEQGFYNVTFFAEEEGRASITYYDLRIGNGTDQLPTPSFSLSKRVGVAPMTVNFDASFSSDDGSISSYYWHLGDNLPRVDNYAIGSSLTRTYKNEGHYYVRLGVKDDAGNVNYRHETIVVLDSVDPSNVNPVASFAASVNDLEVSFNANTSTDSDGNIMFYEWSFGDGKIGNQDNPNMEHTYASAGSYQVTLKVTDNQGGTHTSTQTVVVTAPSANLLRVSNKQNSVRLIPRRYAQKAQSARRKSLQAQRKKRGCEREGGVQTCYVNSNDSIRRRK